MQPSQILAQLLDIPFTFQRPGAPYSWTIASLAGGEAGYAQASDGVVAMAAGIPTAQGPWLGVWGEIYDLPRLAGEADAAYAARILFTLASPVGPPLAIQTWSQLFFQTSGIFVTEAFPTVGYSISLPAGLSTSSLAAWVSGLARIRPAGVPISVFSQTGPLMLGTYSYIGASGFAGSYLGAGVSPAGISIGASTLNARPSIPTLLLTDPLLNGQINLSLPATL